MNWLLVWLYLSSPSDGKRSPAAPTGVAVVVASVAVTVGVYVAVAFVLSDLLGPVVFRVVLAAALTALAAGVVVAVRGHRRLGVMAARQAAGRCVRCGYDLRGSATTACPECGAPCVAHRPRHMGR